MKKLQSTLFLLVAFYSISVYSECEVITKDLSGVENVSYGKSYSNFDYSSNSELVSLKIKGCDSIINLTISSSNLQELIVENSKNIKEIDANGLILNSEREVKIKFKNLPSLENLSLNHMGIKDVRFLKELTNLTFLDLCNNRIDNIKPLTKLTNLNTLYLANNKVSDITPLSIFDNLRVYVAGNNITKTFDKDGVYIIY